MSLDADALAAHVRTAFDAMRAGRWAEADAALGPILADEDLRNTQDLADVLARAHTWKAQARLALGDLSAARAACDDALRAWRVLGQVDALNEVRELASHITREVQRVHDDEKRRAAQAALAVRDAHAVLEGVTDPLERVNRLVEKAGAEISFSRPEEAERYARWALTIALASGDVRGEVLSRLAVARANPGAANEQLVAAWHRAERANEFNLVGAVARAAELQHVRLPALDGASGRWVQ